MCHRPYGEDSSHPDPLDASDANSMSPAYWDMLQGSLMESDTSPRPQAEGRRLAPYVAEYSEDDQYASTTPEDAEFVASEPRPSTGISSSAFSQDYFKTFFREEKELGRGGKGVVLLVSHYLDNCFLGQFACKRVPVGDDHAWLEKVLLEVQTLQRLSHANLVQYRHVWLENHRISSFGPKVPCAFILQQYCDSGDLHNYVLGSSKAPLDNEQLKDRLRKRSKGQMERPNFNGPRKMAFDEIFSFFKDITSGLHHLHYHNFIHRDIKPSNCLLDNTGRRLKVLLSDFGEVQSSDSIRGGTGATGTVSYCAPEVLKKDGDAFGNFSVKSDIFSVGMVVYFMCFAKLPYSSADDINEDMEDVDQLRDEIMQWTGFDDERRGRPDLPEQLYQFLKRLLAIRPEDRPSTDEILHQIRNAPDFEEEEEYQPHKSFDRGHRVTTMDPSAPKTRRPSRSSPGRSSFSNGLGPKSTSRSSSDMSPQKVPRREPPPPELGDGSSLVVHRRRHLQPHASSESFDDPVRPTSPRLALPPPPPRSFVHRLPTFRLPLLPIFRISLFLLKCFSIWSPCRPLSSRPAVAFPLLVLGALDFGTSGRGTNVLSSLSWSIALLVVHLLIIALVGKTGALCEDLSSFDESLRAI